MPAGLQGLQPALAPQGFPLGMLRPGGHPSLVPGDSQDHPNVPAGVVLRPGRSAAAPSFWEQNCWVQVGNPPGAFQGLSFARSLCGLESTHRARWGEGTKRVPVSPVPAPKEKGTKLGVTL